MLINVASGIVTIVGGIMAVVFGAVVCAFAALYLLLYPALFAVVIWAIWHLVMYFTG